MNNKKFKNKKNTKVKNKFILNRAASYVLASAMVIVSQPFIPSNLVKIYAYAEKSAIVNASSLNIRSEASSSSSKVASLRAGTEVIITDETTGSDGSKWYKVRFGEGAEAKTGYALSTYINTTSSSASYTRSEDFEKALDAQGFPEDYKEALRKLHAQYPNWVFKAQKVDIDWQTAVENESVVGRNLVSKNSVSSWKSTAEGAYNWSNSTWPGFDSSAWVAASGDIIRYYMDPRNFLDPVNVFQFLNQGYNENKYDVEGIEAMVRGTYLESRASNSQVLNAKRDISSSASSGSQSPAVNTEKEKKDSNVSLTAPVAQQPEKKETPKADKSVQSESSFSGVSLTPPTASASGNTDEPQNGSGSEKTEETQTASTDANDPVSEKSSSIKLEAPAKDAALQEKLGYGPISGSLAAGDTAGPSNGEKTSFSEINSQNGPGIWLDSENGNNARSSGIDKNAKSSDNKTNEDTNYTPIEGNKTYVDIILEAAVVSGVNPYVLTSMLIQEQGREGKSGLISGNTEPYKGIYNYFNVQAYEAAGMSPTQRGLWWASQSGSYSRPWNSRDKAIIGGAIFYGDNYVKANQDTFYLKKFNVLGTNLYKHQYMTNIEGGADEGARLSQAYSDSLKNGELVFSIPVYKNMPSERAKLPNGDGSPNNKLSSLSVEGYSLTPSFSKDIEKYDIIVSQSITSINIGAQAVDAKASISGTGTVDLSGGNNSFNIEVKAENGTVRNYVINVVRQGGGQASKSTGTQENSPKKGSNDTSLTAPNSNNSTGDTKSKNSASVGEGVAPSDSKGISTDRPKLVSPGGDGN